MHCSRRRSDGIIPQSAKRRFLLSDGGPLGRAFCKSEFQRTSGFIFPFMETA
jgi:hypothetical protein